MTSIPRLWVLTDRKQARRDLPDLTGHVAEAGAEVIVVREKDLPAEERSELATEIAQVVGTTGAIVLLASWRGPIPHGIAGIHLAQHDPLPDLRCGGLVGQSCHGASELRDAAAAGLDYATLSPIFSTASKPGYGPALGLDALQQLAEESPIPIVALGGVTPETGAACLTRGAAGIAVMGTVMRAEEPGAVIRKYIDAMEGSCAMQNQPP